MSLACVCGVCPLVESGVDSPAALGEPALNQNRRVADKAGMAVLVTLALGAA
jgi:hypothetical protein